jgi:hypothetical protein
MKGFLRGKTGIQPKLHVWPSFHVFHVVVKKDLRWKLGNGEKVYVWSQPWLKNEEHALIMTEVVAGKEDMKVAELINQDTRTWKHDLINQMFNTRDAQEIMKLSLNCVNNDDQPIWRCSKSNSYTVRSTYYQLTQVIIDNNHLMKV